MDERDGARPGLDLDDVADEERVVAGLVLGADAALDPAERSVEERDAEPAGPALDAGPECDRRDAAGEVLGSDW